jgi:thiol-disulfide isomerase/thioredoxin
VCAVQTIIVGMSSFPTFKRKRILRWSIEILLFLVVLYGVQHWRTRGATSGTAPPLDRSLIDGEVFSLTAAPRPLLVYFWGTWCPVCRMQQGAIDALAEDAGVITVALSSGSDKDIAAYLGQHGLDFPVVNDEDGSIAAQWGVQGVPTSFIIDEKDQVRFVTSGYTTGPGLRARLWLTRLRP